MLHKICTHTALTCFLLQTVVSLYRLACLIYTFIHTQACAVFTVTFYKVWFVMWPIPYKKSSHNCSYVFYHFKENPNMTSTLEENLYHLPFLQPFLLVQNQTKCSLVTFVRSNPYKFLMRSSWKSHMVVYL